MMADLPKFRVQEAHPFSVVGIDYAGPLQMKKLSLRKARICKVYIAVFVCMTTKAVHLESVSALSTDLMTLDRFVARRGQPSSIYSDCGINFVGAAKQLRRLINHPDQRDKVTGHLSCEWHFNPPGAPHFGGIWEAAVKSAKSLLLRTMNAQIWTLEEFTMLLLRLPAQLLCSHAAAPLTCSTAPFTCCCSAPRIDWVELLLQVSWDLQGGVCSIPLTI